ncbi:unnamed protein product [Lampetra fluviatilis]
MCTISHHLSRQAFGCTGKVCGGCGGGGGGDFASASKELHYYPNGLRRVQAACKMLGARSCVQDAACKKPRASCVQDAAYKKPALAEFGRM